MSRARRKSGNLPEEQPPETSWQPIAGKEEELIAEVNGFTKIHDLGTGGEGRAILYGKDEQLYVGKIHNLPLIIGSAEDLGKKLQNEKDILNKLGHLQLPRHHGFFELGSNKYISFRDYIPGESLADIISQHGPLKQERAIKLAHKLANIYAYLHDPQKHPAVPDPVIHRDTKPQNIIINEELPHLIDFGIAKIVQNIYTTIHEKRHTKEYMAPEQNNGVAVPASDIYSLGITIVESLTGERPAEYHDRWIERAAKGIPTAPAELTNQLDINNKFKVVLNRMIDLDVDKRYQNGGELKSALEEMMNARAISIQTQEKNVEREELFFPIPGEGVEKLIERMSIQYRLKALQYFNSGYIQPRALEKLQQHESAAELQNIYETGKQFMDTAESLTNNKFDALPSNLRETVRFTVTAWGLSIASMMLSGPEAINAAAVFFATYGSEALLSYRKYKNDKEQRQENYQRLPGIVDEFHTSINTFLDQTETLHESIPKHSREHRQLEKTIKALKYIQNHPIRAETVLEQPHLKQYQES